MIALALDPGVTTGAAVGTITGRKLLVRSSQYRFDHIELWQQLEILKPDFVITEDFEIRRNSPQGLVLFSLELIGVMEIWTTLNHKALFRQKASEGKGYFSNSVLKKNGVYKPNKVHAMDATRHLLHWYTFGWGVRYNNHGFEREKPKVNPGLKKLTVYRKG